MDLEKRFGKLISRQLHWLTGENLFFNLEHEYAKGDRYYHTLEHHIMDSLEKFDEIKHLLEEPDQVEGAIFGHDAIYDVLRKDNEVRSAKFMVEMFKTIGVKNGFVRGVSDLILDTVEYGGSNHADSPYMLDIDFSNFGSSWKEFLENTEKIKKEYSIVPGFTDELFVQGRKDFLRGVLKHDRIFPTDYFYERYEDRARENIERYLRDF